MIDKFNRNINYVRISVTDNCNFKCKYCMPSGYECSNNTLSNDEFVFITKQLVELGITKVRLTGGEPLTRKNILELIKEIGEIDGLKDFCITTNGSLLEKYAHSLKQYNVNKINISIDTLDKEKFDKFTKGNLDDVLKGLHTAIDLGFKVKVNVVLMKNFNDNEIIDFCKLTKDLPIDVRFIELMPIGDGASFSLSNFLSLDAILEKCKESNLNLTEVNCDDVSSPAKYYKLDNAKGNIGLIRPITCKFCDSCNRIRLTSKGFLKLCLHDDLEIDLKKALDDKEDLKKLILESIERKPKEHLLEDKKYIKRNMAEIGG